MAVFDFSLKRIAQRVRAGAVAPSKDQFLAKLRSLSGHLRQEIPQSAVLLIGLDESSPLTIIEGNHRMVAATMVSPSDRAGAVSLLLRLLAAHDGMLLV